jgi:hypothetical protein
MFKDGFIDRVQNSIHASECCTQAVSRYCIKSYTFGSRIYIVAACIMILPPTMIIPTLLVCLFYLCNSWIRQPVAHPPNAYDHTGMPVYGSRPQLISTSCINTLLTVICRYGRDLFHRLGDVRVGIIKMTIRIVMTTILMQEDPTLRLYRFVN